MMKVLFGESSLSIKEHYTPAEYKEGVKSILAAISKCMIEECRVDLPTPEGPDATVIFRHVKGKDGNEYKIQVIPHAPGGTFKDMPIYHRWLYFAMLDFYKRLVSEYVPLKEKSMEDTLSFLNKVKDPEYLTKREKEIEKQTKVTNILPPVLTAFGMGSSLVPNVVEFLSSEHTKALDNGLIGLNGMSGISGSNGNIVNSSNLPIDEQKEMRDNVRKTAATVSDIRKHMVGLNKTSARSCVQRPVSFRRRMFK